MGQDGGQGPLTPARALDLGCGIRSRGLWLLSWLVRLDPIPEPAAQKASPRAGSRAPSAGLSSRRWPSAHNQATLFEEKVAFNLQALDSMMNPFQSAGVAAAASRRPRSTGGRRGRALPYMHHANQS